MPGLIVTANYRDRSSPYRWLIRKSEEPIASAAAYQGVIAHGGTFLQSFDGEEGFGCLVVAECVGAVGYMPEGHDINPMPDFDPKAYPTQLTFHILGFMDTKEEWVESCDSLYLAPDGKMFAMVKTDDVADMAAA